MFFISRIKQWLGYEDLTNTDLNNEFNNLVQKAGSDTLSGANSTNGSAPTVAAMRATENPGAVGSEVLSTTVQEDEQQLRYQISAIIGGTYWYSPPPANLATLNSNISGLYTYPPSRIISGRIDANDQPMFLVPDGTAATVALKAASTNFVAYFNGTLTTFNADLSVTSLQTAAAVNNTALVNDTALTGQQSSKTQGERGTYITIDTIGSGISALNGSYAAFKTGTEYFIAEVDTTNNRLKNCIRGVGFSSADAWSARVALSNNDTITLMKLTWVFATYNATTAALAITYNKPVVAFAQPSGPAIGDYWYDIANATWKVYNGTSFTTTIAVFVGVCIQDTTGCKVARSWDFFHIFNALNTFEVEYVSSALVRANRIGQRASVYGTSYYFDLTQPSWDTATNLDSGVSLAADTTYYCYLTDTGNVKISDVASSERRFDLLGAYHPAKPWRCLADFQTDGSSNIIASSLSQLLYPETGPLQNLSKRNLDASTTSGPLEISNAILVASVGSGALTLAIKTIAGTDANAVDVATVSFRSATLTSGAYVRRQLTSSLSTVISSGSTLGHTNATEGPIYVYLLDNAGSMEICYSTSPVDERYLQTTTAEGGAGAADSLAILYSTTARSNVAVRLIDVMKSTQTTAGTWAAVPTAISAPTQPHPLALLPKRYTGTTVGVGGLAISASSGAFTTSSAAYVDITNLTVTLTTIGNPVEIRFQADGTGTEFTNVGCLHNSSNSAAYAFFDLVRDGVTDLYSVRVGMNSSTLTNAGDSFSGPGTLNYIDTPAAGTHTYKLQVKVASVNSTCYAQYVKMLAFERL